MIGEIMPAFRKANSIENASVDRHEPTGVLRNAPAEIGIVEGNPP